MMMVQSAYRFGVRPVLGAAGLLLVPLVAMQFTHEVNWTASDFAVAGVLLLGAGIPLELALKKGGNLTYGLAAGLALATALFLVWSNLAVGIVGEGANPINISYFGVLGVGIADALLARFRARGLAGALLAMALAQALVTAAALFLLPNLGSGPVEILAVNGFFILLFVASAKLFRQAARVQPHPSEVE